MSPLALLDLSKPGERQAHDFLVRATIGRDRMWELTTLRRQGDVLLCVVRWVYPEDPTQPFALAEVSLTETAVYWRRYATAEAARDELTRRGAETAASVCSVSDGAYPGPAVHRPSMSEKKSVGG